MSLTERDLDLIEVALESAISATGSGFSQRDSHDMTSLAAEYRHALTGARKIRLAEKKRRELRGDPLRSLLQVAGVEEDRIDATIAGLRPDEVERLDLLLYAAREALHLMVEE